MTTWDSCKKVLCIRPDNMGDVLMSSPALAAMKESFGCSITVLTSSFGKDICCYIPAIDEVLVWDVPWVKATEPTTLEDFWAIVEIIKQKAFDAAVIFTVFSQNPLPTALMATLAGIPKRLAYCRENPYHLLTDWIPDHEPYDFIRHQVRRDLDLVRSIGAATRNEKIILQPKSGNPEGLRHKLIMGGADPDKPWIIMHPGVSEEKRKYPAELWIEAGKQIVNELNYQLIITGVDSEKELAENIREGIGPKAYTMAGLLTLDEFIHLIKIAPLVISVNTGSVHLAAALGTKIIVLYALTNPQHSPWKSIGKVLPFPVAKNLRSRNVVLQFVHDKYYNIDSRLAEPNEIVQAAHDLLILKKEPAIPELVLLEIESL